MWKRKNRIIGCIKKSFESKQEPTSGANQSLSKVVIGMTRCSEANVDLLEKNGYLLGFSKFI